MEAKNDEAQMEYPFVYAWERLYTAVRTLAVGRGSIQERLTVAFSSELCRLSSGPQGTSPLPEMFRERFTRIHGEVTQMGEFADTILALPDARAAELASEVFSMYAELDRHYRDWHSESP